jgi:hypothetical protein
MEPQRGLSTVEAKEFKKCESTIATGLKAFLAVGEALFKIRDNRLYRREYESFEDYLRRKWKISRTRGYQLIDAAKVAKDLAGDKTIRVVAKLVPPRREWSNETEVTEPSPPTSTVVDTLPQRESQVRPLAGIPSRDQRREAWQQAVSSAGGNQPTAKQVAAAAKQVTAKAGRSSRPIHDAELDDKVAKEMGEKITSMRQSYWLWERLNPMWDELDAVIAKYRKAFREALETEKAMTTTADSDDDTNE